MQCHSSLLSVKLRGGSCIIRVPPRLENLENKNDHGKVMEHEKLAKSQGIL